MDNLRNTEASAHGNNVADDAVSAITVTCSLASTRMSPNQTCDDLPGPGRTIDTYFYQPSGRLLETYINWLLARRQLRKEEKLTRMLIEREAIEAIDDAFNGIQAFFSSKFLPTSDELAPRCSHLHWTWDGQKTIWLNLSEYLYVVGAQNIEGWDDPVVEERCTQINNFVSPSNSRKIRARALSAAFCLLSTFPRLRRFFDLTSLRQAGSDASLSYDAFYHIIFQTYDVGLLNVNDFSAWGVVVGCEVAEVFGDRFSIEDLFRRLAGFLPTTRITSTRMLNCRMAFLWLILVTPQKPYWSNPYLVPLFNALINDPALFELGDSLTDWNHPVALFWKKVEGSLDASLSQKLEPRSFSLITALESRLMNTLDSLPVLPGDGQQTLPDNVFKSTFLEEFIHLCFEVLLRLLVCDMRSYKKRVLRLDGSWINVEMAPRAKSVVDARTVMGKSRIDAIWEECRSKLISQLNNHHPPKKSGGHRQRIISLRA